MSAPVVNYFQRILLLMLLGLNIPLQSQSLVWEYEVQMDNTTYPLDFWVDGNGNGFFNIHHFREGRGDKEVFLLMLDNEGAYQGSLYVNSCRNREMLVPFGKNRYITSGNNCLSVGEGKSGLSRDSRMFNKDGQLLRRGEAFPGYYFARVFNNNRGTFFNKPHAKWGYSFLSIGHLTRSLSVVYDSIPLAPVERPGLGIVNNYIQPVQALNGSWIVPFQYGIIKGTNEERITPKHGFVLGVADGKILWQYPDTLNPTTVEAVSSYDDIIGIAMTKKSDYPSMVTLLHETGNFFKKVNLFPACDYIRDMVMSEDHLILLLKDGKVRWYNYDGEMEHEYDFEKGRGLLVKEIQLLSDETIIVTAALGGRAIISKIKREEAPAEEANKIVKEQFAVRFASIQELAEEALSVSVFPNPTAVRLNFSLNTYLGDSYQILVFNAGGQSVYRAVFGEQTYMLEVAQLPAGTYFYKIIAEQEGKKEIVTGKFIKVD